MRIDGLSSQPKISQTQQRSAPVRTKKEGERAGDVVEISQGAQDASELSALARSAPAETHPRLEEIRHRVEAGYYDSERVRRQIADSLLEADSLGETVADIAQFRTAKEQLAQVPDTRPERVDTARQRVGSGFYDRPEVRRDTASRILDELA
jgi:hypothetical protein